jgi:amidase
LVVGHVDLATAAWRKYRVLASATTKGVAMAMSNVWLWDATAAQLAAALDAGETTSVAIVSALMDRISLIDAPGTEIELRSVLALAPDALDQARRADDERAAGKARSRLHGIPILVKDSIEAVGLPGTAGSTALLGRPVTSDAPLITRLREAGLVIFGATNLSQWANMRSPESTSGWSAVGGLTANPYQLDRSAGGSSAGSGAARAARLTPLAVGTETDGSITCPASLNGVVGLKPAVGVVPGAGVVPIAASQDSPGPMARTVADVAALYEVVAGIDGVVDRVAGGASDVRIAVATNLVTSHARTDEMFKLALRRVAQMGITTTDITVVEADTKVDADELTVLLCEMADDLTAFLARRGGDGPASVEAIIAFEDQHADVEQPFFGHEYLEQALATGGRAGAVYHDARSRNVAWAIDQCLEPALRDVDCFVAPCYGPAWKHDLVLGGHGSARCSQVAQAPAIAGWPIATVPMGLINGLPVGLSIVGRPGSEATLLAVAQEFEKALQLTTDGSLVPQFNPSRRG